MGVFMALPCDYYSLWGCIHYAGHAPDDGPTIFQRVPMHGPVVPIAVLFHPKRSCRSRHVGSGIRPYEDLSKMVSHCSHWLLVSSIDATSVGSACSMDDGNRYTPCRWGCTRA